MEQDKQKEVDEWVRFGMRLTASAILHPFEYSKVLIQLGYEPIAPKHGKSFFGNPILVLPNIFQYAGYIRKRDGFFGWYRGLTPVIVGSVIGTLCTDRIADKCGFSVEPTDKNAQNEEELYIEFKKNLKRDLAIQIAGITITYPFQVISVRMMAQFIGQETIYKSITESVIEIYKTQGIFGFFAGFIPKLLCDVTCLVLSSTTVYLLNKYLIEDASTRQYTTGFTQFAYGSILYPLQVVSTCMKVSGTRLKAGTFPLMPEYINWRDCWNDLQARGELKRGSSLFWRSARGPNLSNKKLEIAPLPAISRYN